MLELRAQTNNQLKKPINSLEKVYDQELIGEFTLITQLKTKYKILFKQLDGLFI